FPQPTSSRSSYPCKAEEALGSTKTTSVGGRGVSSYVCTDTSVHTCRLYYVVFGRSKPKQWNSGKQCNRWPGSPNDLTRKRRKGEYVDTHGDISPQRTNQTDPSPLSLPNRGQGSREGPHGVKASVTRSPRPQTPRPSKTALSLSTCLQRQLRVDSPVNTMEEASCPSDWKELLPTCCSIRESESYFPVWTEAAGEAAGGP
ncbi:hypothetical protein CTA2_1677, partial [Colletotrichum tanaceti]